MSHDLTKLYEQIDEIEIASANLFEQPRVPQISLEHVHTRMEIRVQPPAEVVQNGDLMPLTEVCIDDIGADEAGSPRYEHPHAEFSSDLT